MTIIEKVKKLLNANKTMNLKDIYEALPEHTPSSIRGNINRYLLKDTTHEFERIASGIYSIIEIIKVSKNENDKTMVNYISSYYARGKEIDIIHKDFVTPNVNIQPGVYSKSESFDTYEDFVNDKNSIKAILMHDDAIEVLKRLESESFDLIITDPPYRTISGGHDETKSNVPSGMLAKNDGKIFKYNNIKFSDYIGELYRVLKNNSQAYFFTNFLNLQELMIELQKVGFKLHNLLVWEKDNATPNRWYMKNCEYVIFARKGKAKAINNKGCKTVQQFKNIIGNKIHETEKPLDLLQNYILNSSQPDDWILDPFGGSGSTMAAALTTNRKCFSCEIDEKYIPRIRERISNILRTNHDFRENTTPSTT